ncbi:uncharacterized protein PHACADRAFT_132240, partial [Phanerochaete carnosa HHB-10118-sp]
MFIAIVGTRLSGKSTVQEYLLSFKGFNVLRLVERDSSVSTLAYNSTSESELDPVSVRIESSTIEDHLTFSSHTEMLDYVTKNWRSDFVTVDLRSQSLLEKFSTRPFFMVVSVDAPILIRYHRSMRRVSTLY